MVRLEGNTTDIPDAVVKAIVALISPTSRPAVLVVRNSSRGGGCSGRFSVARDARVTLTVGCESTRYVTMPRVGKGYLSGYALGSRAECVLFVLAHELRHLWQHHHTRGRVYGSRGRYSERDADAYALGVLRRYRRGEIRGLADLMAQIPAGIDPIEAAERANLREAARARRESNRARKHDPLRDLPLRVRGVCPPGSTCDGDFLDAPPGFVWSASGEHCLGIGDRDWSDLVERIGCGVEPCDCEECAERQAA